MRFGETRVPIPNTIVKTKAADGTALETVWESRWLPDLQNREEYERKRSTSPILCRSAGRREAGLP